MIGKRFGRAALAAAAAVALVISSWRAFEASRDTVAETVRRVPAAEHVFAFRGAGFDATPGGYTSESASLKRQDAAQTIVVTAPARANEKFELRDGRGRDKARVRLVGAATSAARLERGRMIYADAYPSVDVVGTRDPEHFELAYIAHTTRFPKLELAVGADADSKLELEAGSGAAILRAADGRPKLRVERPVAFDAAGRTRSGSYVVADAGTLEIRMRGDGLVPPIVIDPAFFIPFWTLTHDGRAPGGLAYDPERAERESRETQIVLNAATGKPWLLRPSASHQESEYRVVLGAPIARNFYLPFSTTPRVSGQNGPAPDPLLLTDFRRTVFRDSEVYEWRNNGWQLLAQTGLPGFVDPTVAFDAGRGRMVAMGGLYPGATRDENFTFASAVFEHDGADWLAKGVPGGPPPRVRAAAVGFGSKIVVFGGRTLETPFGQITSGGGIGAPVVSNSTLEDLLNDTWTYDGSTWRKVPTSNPPPACERSQLIHDTRRDRVVLVGGNCAFAKANKQHPSDFDGFRLWEFDGSDWIQRFGIDDPNLPRSFRLRRGVAAAWNPVRETTTLFGGFIDVTDQCPLTPEQLSAQRFQGERDIALRNDFSLKTQLQSQGCWGGYAQDTWEWDGATLRALTQVAFGGMYAERGASPAPLFQQVSAPVPPPTRGSDSRAPGNSKLWPWRFDADSIHFAQRSALERSAAQSGVPIAPAKTVGGQAALPVTLVPSNPVISPQFAPSARPQLVVAPDTGRLLIFFSGDGRIFETNLAAWTDLTPQTSPFASGQNDFTASAWDSARKLAVVFDPTTGSTWERGDNLGWRRVQTANSPGIWNRPAWWKRRREMTNNLPSNPQIPRMSYDRARSRMVMFHRSVLWEYNGATWVQVALPSGLATELDGANPRTCKASSLLAFDGARNRTVLIGCSVPAQTWEWDGTRFFGPFASPFQARILRQFVPSTSNFTGTLEGDWAHPNAVIESPSLGGVGIVDADGTLRVWKGSSWETGPSRVDLVTADSASRTSEPVPRTYYPPLIEDFSGNRVLAFRDGIRALRQLSFSVPLAQRQWEEAYVGDALSGTAVVHPFPMELLPVETTGVNGWADPATAVRPDGQLSTNPKAGFANLFWPFRLLADPVDKRVRVLTHRGVLWELGSERVSGTGEACVSNADCRAPDACLDGVCCQDSQCTGACLTCNGANPGRCEAIPAGVPDPKARCGGGECAGVCSGALLSAPPRSSCSFPAGRTCGGTSCQNGTLTGSGRCQAGAAVCTTGTFAPQACPGGLACRDGTSCKTACASATDCAQRGQTCAPDAKSCVSDGKLCHSDSECPRFNACSTDGMSCSPDRAAIAAAALNVTPSTWEPPPMRSLQEMADLLHAEGFERDEQGRILFRDLAMGGMMPMLDPNLKTPLMGLRGCVYRIQACVFATGQMDACVAGAARCTSSTPWLGDSAGVDCCPLECLTEFLEARPEQSSFRALSELTTGSCYPGLQSYYEEFGQ